MQYNAWIRADKSKGGERERHGGMEGWREREIRRIGEKEEKRKGCEHPTNEWMNVYGVSEELQLQAMLPRFTYRLVPFSSLTTAKVRCEIPSSAFATTDWVLGGY